MAISKQDVFRIADQMFADGVQPTLITLRAALGSGSFSTISTFLAEWKTTTRSGEVLDVQDVPEEVTHAFYPALASVWQKAVEHAALRTAEAVEAAALLVKDAESRCADALELAQALQTEVDQFTTKNLCLAALNQDHENNIRGLSLRIAGQEATEIEFRHMHAEFVRNLKAKPKTPSLGAAPKVEPLKPSRRKPAKQGQLDV